MQTSFRDFCAREETRSALRHDLSCGGKGEKRAWCTGGVQVDGPWCRKIEQKTARSLSALAREGRGGEEREERFVRDGQPGVVLYSEARIRRQRLC